MGNYDDILKKLEKKFQNEEITKETYRSIKARYEKRLQEMKEISDEIEGIEEKDEIEEFKEKLSKEIPSVKERKNIIKISGAGKLSQVYAKELKCSGSTKVEGNVDAYDVKMSGSCKISGSVKSKTFKASGSSKIEGNARSEMFKTAGSCKINGNVDCDEFHTAGSCSIGGMLYSNNKVVVDGSMTVGGDIKAKEFRCAGKFDVGGSISSQTINVELNGHSSARVIEAENIEVKKMYTKSLFGRVFKVKGSLKANKIIGTTIYLEDTTAEFVRGEDVTIGPNCRIDAVEFKKLSVHESSKVKNRKIIK